MQNDYEEFKGVAVQNEAKDLEPFQYDCDELRQSLTEYDKIKEKPQVKLILPHGNLEDVQNHYSSQHV